MIKGVGVDLVDSDELARLLDVLDDRLFTHIFTAGELADAAADPRRAEQLAIRFGVKEAVFKAIAHLLPQHFFDMRVVESVNEPDGYLRVDPTPALRTIMGQAGITDIQVSASTENQYVTVIALAQ